MTPGFSFGRRYAPGSEYVLLCANSDRELYAHLYDGSHELQRAEKRSHRVLPHANFLLQDLFQAYYQIHHHFNTDVSPYLHRHVRLIDWLIQTPSYASLHKDTAGNSHAAALATLATYDDLVDRLDAQQTRKGARSASTNSEIRRSSGGPAFRTFSWPFTKSPLLETQTVTMGSSDKDSESDLLSNYAIIHAADHVVQVVKTVDTLRNTWGMYPGSLENYPIDEVWGLSHEITYIPDFVALTQLIADLQGLTGQHQKRHKTAPLPQKITGVRTGRSLDHLVPEEIVKLSDSDLEGLFHDAYENQALIHFSYMGERPDFAPPLICCIDTSASMNQPAARGLSRLAWAKAVAVALLSIARDQKRTFCAFCFAAAGQLESFQAPKGQISAQDIVSLSQCHFGGGTHLETPLEATLAYARKEATQGVDVVLLTDGEAPLDEAYFLEFEKQQHNLEMRLYAMFVDGMHEQLSRLCRSSFHIASSDEGSWCNALKDINRRLRN